MRKFLYLTAVMLFVGSFNAHAQFSVDEQTHTKEGEVKFADPAAAATYGAKLEKLVEGDADFSAEDAGMGVLQYRLTHTSAMGAMATLQLPSYSMAICYPSDQWLSTQLVEGGTQVIMNPEGDEAKGHILFFDSSWSVFVRLVCIYNAAK